MSQSLWYITSPYQGSDKARLSNTRKCCAAVKLLDLTRLGMIQSCQAVDSAETMLSALDRFVLNRWKDHAGTFSFMQYDFMSANHTQLNQVTPATVPYRALVVRSGST
jgi:hypothetical protein